MSMLGGLANAIGLGGNAAQQAQGVIQGGAYQGQGLMNAQPGAYKQISNQAAMAKQQTLMQQYQAAQQAMVEDFDPNKHEAWTMSMSTLVNLWRAKYLDEWMLIHSDKLEPFWRQAWSRLSGANKFERSPGQWIRLREDA